MTPTPKPPPEISERQTNSRDINAPAASFRLGELEMAFAQLISLCSAHRMRQRLLATTGGDLDDETPISVTEAARLLLHDLMPSGCLRSPLALASAILEGGGVQCVLAPADALNHPALRSLIRPSLLSFCEAMLGPDFVPVMPFPVERITTAEFDQYQGAQVRLVLSEAPEFYATLAFGSAPVGTVIVHGGDIAGHVPYAIGALARWLRHPEPNCEAVEQMQTAMAAARVADAVLH